MYLKQQIGGVRVNGSRLHFLECLIENSQKFVLWLQSVVEFAKCEVPRG